MIEKKFPLPSTFEDALKISRQALSEQQHILQNGSIDSEAEQLVIGAYRKAKNRSKTFGRNDLYMLVMQPFPKDAGEVLIEYLKERISGRPLQYILGYQTFLYHEYLVNESTLIPRPETESLVYEIVQYFKRQIEQPKIGFELGLGTGCISIELLKIFPELKMFGTDLSEKALEITQKNRDRILGKEERLEVFVANEKEILPHQCSEKLKNIQFDFIVSNPPYLAGREEMNEDVWENEPHSALLSPINDVNYFYREITEQLFPRLKQGGVIFFEIPHERAEEIFHLLKSWGEIELIKDLTGRERILKIRRVLNG